MLRLAGENTITYPDAERENGLLRGDEEGTLSTFEGVVCKERQRPYYVLGRD